MANRKQLTLNSFLQTKKKASTTSSSSSAAESSSFRRVSFDTDEEEEDGDYFVLHPAPVGTKTTGLDDDGDKEEDSPPALPVRSCTYADFGLKKLGPPAIPGYIQFDMATLFDMTEAGESTFNLKKLNEKVKNPPERMPEEQHNRLRKIEAICQNGEANKALFVQHGGDPTWKYSILRGKRSNSLFETQHPTAFKILNDSEVHHLAFRSMKGADAFENLSFLPSFDHDSLHYESSLTFSNPEVVYAAGFITNSVVEQLTASDPDPEAFNEARRRDRVWRGSQSNKNGKGFGNRNAVGNRGGAPPGGNRGSFRPGSQHPNFGKPAPNPFAKGHTLNLGKRKAEAGCKGSAKKRENDRNLYHETKAWSLHYFGTAQAPKLDDRRRVAIEWAKTMGRKKPKRTIWSKLPHDKADCAAKTFPEEY